MLKIDVGCGGKGSRYVGYTGLDIWPISGITRNPDSYVEFDCVKNPLPFPPDSVDHVICLHVLEHLTRHDAWMLCLNIRGVLKPGAEAIFAVPDLRIMAQKYLERDEAFYSKEAKPGIKVWNGATFADQFLDSIIGMNMSDGKHGHRYAYDLESLRSLVIDESGFIDPKFHTRETTDLLTFSKRPDHEVFLRVTKR